MEDLLNLPPRRNRDYDAKKIAELASNLTKTYSISFADALKCIEMEFTSIDQDRKDDQLYAFGELVKKIVDALNDIADGDEAKNQVLNALSHTKK